jgi:hypothetical protein
MKSDIKSFDDMTNDFVKYMAEYDAIDIKIDDKFITLRGDYPISLSRCDTAEKILGWLLHLSEKNWFDRGFQTKFVSMLVHRFNIKADIQC